MRALWSCLLRYKDLRYLFFGQVVSILGSMVSYVAIPYQVYELTKSNALVGALASVQIIPLVLFGLWGGAVADSMDRRKLLIISEAILAVGVVILAVNSFFPNPSVVLIFVVSFIFQAANGFHRPAMEAASQSLVRPEDYGSLGALAGLRFTVGAIIGPAIGGLLIGWGGIKTAYIFDCFTFVAAIGALILMKPLPIEKKTSENKNTFGDIKMALQFAMARPQLMGTYIVDIIANTFAFPVALFPALAEQFGVKTKVGYLYSAMSCGALVMGFLGAWTVKEKRHGRIVVYAASIWGLCIVAFGFSNSFWLALVFLVFSGAADGISAVFRSVIWNETIPNEIRGRMAGIEMISYMIGPLLGNLRAGTMASFSSVSFSIIFGGVFCFVGVIVCAFFLPKFWQYRSQITKVSTD